MSMLDAEEAVELAEEIIRLIDEDVPEQAFDRADAGFFEGIRERAGSIGETIEKTGRASDKQVAALQNMEDAVKKWIH